MDSLERRNAQAGEREYRNRTAITLRHNSHTSLAPNGQKQSGDMRNNADAVAINKTI
jgi:hypothetical protein